MASINNLTAVYADRFYLSSSTGVSEISDTYATKTEVENLNFATDITANTDAIAVLNTKQLQNFNNINAINTDLTNNYQTNTVLATNFYNKTEIDATFTNYYTSTQIDTNLSSNYQNNALLATNFYNKSEIDANNWIDATALTPYVLTSTLTSGYYTIAQTQANYYDKTYIDANIGGGGYTDLEIDSFLSLKEDKATFTDKISFTPIVDISAPAVIHNGLTLKNSTVNVEPVEGLLFSNQTGGGDKVISVFKNATNYITLQGNKIIANATSDDSLTNLDLNPSNSVSVNDLSVGGVATFTDNVDLTSSTGDIQVPVTGMDIVRASGDANYNLRIRDTQGVWEFRNRNFRCMNPSNPANGTEMILHDTGGDYRLRIGSQTTAQVGIGVQYNASYFLNVGGLSNFNQARVATDLEVVGDINLTTDLNLTGALNFDGTTANINNATDGLTFYKATTDASNVMTVANDSGKLKFRSFGIDSYLGNDAPAELF